MEAGDNLRIHIKYRELEATYEGTPDEVLASIIDFLKRAYPYLEILARLQLTADLRRLSEAIQGIVGIYDAGPILLVNEQLTSDDRIALLLSGAYVGGQLGMLPKDRLSLKDLIRLSGMPKGTIAPALKRLKGLNRVERSPEGGYRISPIGISDVLGRIIPRLKSLGGPSVVQAASTRESTGRD